jgi:uncharacterized phage protein gp47/JayE
MASLDNGPIDYTSRDYVSIREDLLNAVSARLPYWNSTDPNDFLRVLVESFAFVGDLNSYYIDRVANEAFLPTATQRQSLINIARTFGYTPAGPLSASTSLLITNNGSSSVTLPAGTQFKGVVNYNGVTSTVYYETTAAVTIAAGANAAGQIAIEGATQYGSRNLQANGDFIGVLLSRTDGASASDGSASQEFYIPTTPVAEGSISVWAHPISGTATILDGVQYTYLANLIDAGPDDKVFTVVRYANGRTSVVFGDGSSGFIPPANYQIRATYAQGGGLIGNTAANTNLTLVSLPNGTTPAGVSAATEVSASGGAEEESNESLRNNAYRSLRISNRAVNLSDFADVALQQPGISRANAIGSAISSVVVYVAPWSSSSTDTQPGYAPITITNISNKAQSTTTATLTTSTAHGLVAGQIITVSGVGSPFDGTWAISSVTSTTIVYTVPTSATLASTSATGIITAIGGETSSFTSLKASTATSLAAAAPVGCDIVVAGPVYVDLRIRLTARLADGVRQSIATTDITTSLLYHFSAQNMPFGALLYDSEVLGMLALLSSVNSASITTFARATDYSNQTSTDLNTGLGVSLSPYEVPRLTSSNLTISFIGGINDLS